MFLLFLAWLDTKTQKNIGDNEDEQKTGLGAGIPLFGDVVRGDQISSCRLIALSANLTSFINQRNRMSRQSS